MCGIIGCAAEGGEVASLLHRGLKRLEYRGYDSAGMATISEARIYVKKDSGKIDEIHQRLNFDNMPGSIGIAHTRWATHGAPTQVNAHPQLDCEDKIAIVHNGIIENFLELKEELIERKHVFRSRTDTEVIAHQIEENLRSGKDFLQAFFSAVKRLKGSYALAIISSHEPGKIFFARNESPLVIGLGDGVNFVASDVAAFIERTRRVIFLDNGDAGYITPREIRIYKLESGIEVKKRIIELEWTIEMAEKSGYPHFTLKEINEQPYTLREALRAQEKYLDLLAEFLDRARNVFLVAAGTSHNACVAGSYMFSKVAMLNATPVIASEFIENYGKSIGIDTVILAVSQSGETADVLAAVDHARMRAATVLGITNVVGSTLTRVSRAYVLQNSGPEIGVAATKTFTAQLTVLAQLALTLARKRGKLAQYEIDEFREELERLPELMKRAIEISHDPIKSLAKKLADAKSIFFLGRGASYATAREARLKVMELSYIPCIAYPAGESKHGPISVIEEGYPVFFIAPNDSTRKNVIGNMMEMKARGAEIYCVGTEGDQELRGISDWWLGLPSIHEALSPIIYIVPFQFLAYYLAIERGHDPDKPRNLAKSVTVQ
ncbi:MAG: glutamine--fructose-6-phosphate transaminase (isomerizing) [Nitrososphaeria archaeon]|nr:glutamine--fructose-6-phosphate transaminase (isomerizing) [Aigarchaeota archaeon]MCX8187659.1 glutamine--fructose-6-phosphate transaminase (isomerizing) [Nitrososphaeria archaeon]MDW8021554.1 glutamine--fructose-6-phosphate transaminase (isomerizing) [Nitrososphaerota archaeon]